MHKTPSSEKKRARGRFFDTQKQNKHSIDLDRYIPSRRLNNDHQLTPSSDLLSPNQESNTLKKQPKLGDSSVISSYLLSEIYGVTPEEYTKRRVLNFSAKNMLVPGNLNKDNRYSNYPASEVKFNFNQYKILGTPDTLNDFYSDTVSWSRQEQVSFTINLEGNGSIYSVNNSVQEAKSVSNSETIDNIKVFSVASMANSLIASSWDDFKLRIHSLHHPSGQEIPYCYTTGVGETIISSMIQTNMHTLICGNKGGQLSQIDMRQQKAINDINVSSYVIAGLAYDNHFSLATGSDDQIVRIWDTRKLGLQSVPMPIAMYKDHESCIKGIKFKPDLNRYLISGGGKTCRKLCLYDTQTQTVIYSVDTGSQVTGLHWFATDSRYFVTSHGYSDCSLQLWELSNREIKLKKKEPMGKISYDGRIIGLDGSQSSNQIVAVLAKEEQARFFSISGVSNSNSAKLKPKFQTMLSTPAMTIR